MRTQVPGKLLATAAASAASVTTIGMATAHATETQPPDQAVIDSRIKLSFEGAYFWNNVHKDDKLNSDKLGNSNGDISGSVALTRQISPGLDWRLSGAFHVGKDRSTLLGEGPITGPGNTPGTLGISYGDSYTFQTFDFDVGKHVKVQQADIRFFGGLRLVHSDETVFDVSEKFTPNNPADKGISADKVGTAEYWGIGPRVGAEAYYPVGENWGLTGSASGAIMWGRRTERVGFNISSTNPVDHFSETLASQGSNETVSNLDASLGLSWTPVTNTTFTAGYKVEAWHNLLVNADHKNQVFQGPFLRLEVKM
ncbi:Lpg1974 family pore-forming outer membrane protein [Mesorhizobium sp. WSM4976]|uniref:Lpg1974 family pore-forming outer membrane protein n=1 Tax=Mesorhizobium sp. WSM4976 TaxID=3038549 RepID=UPI0024162278|nr:Lpg1974 family pore-forming outer membrane protein [Mesorhizobium sp. WSM4976]MDG4896839.1 Lpg1974 family pore-forming outer membrane protein [Mesorhizobium sp. WSM4976]